MEKKITAHVTRKMRCTYYVVGRCNVCRHGYGIVARNFFPLAGGESPKFQKKNISIIPVLLKYNDIIPIIF